MLGEEAWIMLDELKVRETALNAAGFMQIVILKQERDKLRVVTQI